MKHTSIEGIGRLGCRVLFFTSRTYIINISQGWKMLNRTSYLQGSNEALHGGPVWYKTESSIQRTRNRTFSVIYITLCLLCSFNTSPVTNDVTLIFTSALLTKVQWSYGGLTWRDAFLLLIGAFSMYIWSLLFSQTAGQAIVSAPIVRPSHLISLTKSQLNPPSNKLEGSQSSQTFPLQDALSVISAGYWLHQSRQRRHPRLCLAVLSVWKTTVIQHHRLRYKSRRPSWGSDTVWWLDLVFRLATKGEIHRSWRMDEWPSR